MARTTHLTLLRHLGLAGHNTPAALVVAVMRSHVGINGAGDDACLQGTHHTCLQRWERPLLVCSQTKT